MKYILKTAWMMSLSIVIAGVYVLPVSASEEKSIDTGETNMQANSNGDTYEYTSIDKDGNIEIIRLPEVDEEEIEQERLAHADSYEMVMKIGDNEEVIATYDDLESAQKAQDMRKYYRTTGTTSIRAVSDYSNIKNGVVDFNTKNSDTNTYYTETGTNITRYINGSYASDGAFLGYCTTDKSKIKFRQAGAEGCVSTSDVIVRDYDSSDVKSVNFYRVENGYIYHYITTNVKVNSYATVINVGPKQSYMANNVVYYSYDGHYFYTSYAGMIADYKAGHFNNSINPNQPYYNYYQFLTQRTKTNITASQFNAYMDSKISGSSLMKGQGQHFIDAQNTYGVNALLMYAVAINESNYGRSTIALEKNNLFGLNATDKNPGENANTYASPKDSIYTYARDYISNNYMDPKDYSGLYYGGHLGDKSSGINVKYASDSYWGEKAASFAYAVDRNTSNVDLHKYQIGIVAKMTNLQVRKEATPSSPALYATGNWAHYPVVILGQTTGYSVEGNNVWYKIQSDPTISADRNSMTQDVKVYDYDNAYGYVSSYYVNRVVYTNASSGDIPIVGDNVLEKVGLRNSGGYVSGFTLGMSVSDFTKKVKAVDPSAGVTVKNSSGSTITSGAIATGQSITITSNGNTNSYQVVIYGDTNGDGKILANDYVFIRNYIMKTGSLSGAYMMAADVNRDGRILANDYVLIRNHIMGVNTISQ